MNWALVVFFLPFVLSSDSPSQLLDDYWHWILNTFPESATNVGVHIHDNKVDPHSEEDRLKHSKIYLEFLQRTNNLLNSEQNENEIINLKILKREVELLKQYIDLKGYLFSISNLDGSQVNFEQTIKNQELKSESDYWKYLERLQALGKQIQEDIELMKIGIREQMTYHNSSVFDVPRQISLLEVDPMETIYYKAFTDEKMPYTINCSQKEELRRSAIKIIKDSIQPAYKELRVFMENIYSKSLRSSIGVSSVPKGKDLYSYMIKKYTSTNMTPEEIHQIGLKEVQRISNEIKKIINGLGFNETIREFSNRIKNSNNFSFTSQEQMLDYAKHLIFDKIYPVLPKVFKRGPKMNLTVEAIPESLAKGAVGYYVPGSVADNRPGIFFLNIFSSLSTYELPSLCLHESSPGHHFQTAYFLEKPGVPEFRKNTNDDVGYMNSAYVEGWAVYTEFLGIELGIYEDPYDLYGHYSSENFRACRLVVDTGIHYFNWTKEQAIDYFLEHTASSRTDIENEINRYITWPGQALAYKIGELKIRDMREYFQKQQGTNFDVKDFHEAVLDCGPVSLEILTDCVDNYIQKKCH